MLKADGHEFAVFVRAARTPATRGTLLLIPGDGSHPTSAAGLEQIRQAMPAHGWATWLLTLEPPPRTHAEKIGAPQGSPPAAAGAAPAGEAPATLDDQRAAALEQWAARSQARIIAATASAAAEGRPLALVAEGSSAVLLTRGMGSAPGAVRGAALLDPVEFPGLALEWPKGLAQAGHGGAEPGREPCAGPAAPRAGRRAAAGELPSAHAGDRELATRRGRCAADAPPARLADYAGPDSRRCCRRPLSSA